MKKNLLTPGVILMSALTFTACGDDNDFTHTQPAVSNTDVRVACAGNWSQNDGTVGILDYNSESRLTAPYIYNDTYRTQNGNGIGGAQDLIIFGTKLVVTCTTSSKVEVLDRMGKKEQTIRLYNASPRYLTTDGNYVYFSTYNGRVHKMNPNNTQKALVDSVEVDDHPETFSVTNGKLYANISGYGSGNTVTVIDCNSFKKTKVLAVGKNPYNQSIAVGSDIYFVSMFNNDGAPVQKINAENGEVKKLFKANSIAYSAKKNALVCPYATYYDTNKHFFIYDLATGRETDLDMTGLKNPSQVNVNRYGNIYVIDTPSYTAPSEVLYYSPEGRLIQGKIVVEYNVQNVRFAN